MENNFIHYEFLIHIPFKYFIQGIQKAAWVSYRTSNVCVFPKLVLLWIWVTTKTYPTLPDREERKLLDLVHLDFRIFVIIKFDSLSGWETWPNFGFIKTCHLFDLHTQLANTHLGRAFTYLGGLLGDGTCPPATRRGRRVRRPWWPGKIMHTFSACRTNQSPGRVVPYLHIISLISLNGKNAFQFYAQSLNLVFSPAWWPALQRAFQTYFHSSF